jgi:hypothetical protein
LLSRGLAVLPVGGETGKQPLVAWAKRTKPSATAFVDKLILRYPDTNVGIICHLSRVTVADIAQAALIHVEDNAPNAAAEAIRITDADATTGLADHEDCEKRARQAIEIVDGGDDQAYARALKALHADTRGWWSEECEDPDRDERPAPTAPALRAFLDETVLPFHAQRMMALRHRHLLRSQAFGMAVRRADLERLGRYETTLDRKLQRILGMLLQLQERRRTIDVPAA